MERVIDRHNKQKLLGVRTSVVTILTQKEFFIFRYWAIIRPGGLQTNYEIAITRPIFAFTRWEIEITVLFAADRCNA